MRITGQTADGRFLLLVGGSPGLARVLDSRLSLLGPEAPEGTLTVGHTFLPYRGPQNLAARLADADEVALAPGVVAEGA